MAKQHVYAFRELWIQRDSSFVNKQSSGFAGGAEHFPFWLHVVLCPVHCEVSVGKEHCIRVQTPGPRRKCHRYVRAREITSRRYRLRCQQQRDRSNSWTMFFFLHHFFSSTPFVSTARFWHPFRVEYVAFLGNNQLDNPDTPPGAVPPASPHRLEGLTLDGGGGAYTGGVLPENTSSAQVTLASAPFGNGTGAYAKADCRFVLCVPRRVVFFVQLM